MARPSKLTAKQWAEIERRIIDGEPVRAIAKEFGISESSIRGRGVTAQAQKTISIANQIVATERAISELPISAQINAQNLASKLRSISDSFASAADLGAKTAHRLHALANAEVCKVDDSDVLSPSSLEAMKGIAVLTKLGNDALMPASNLLAANKELIKKAHDQDEPERLPALRPQVTREQWLAQLN